MHSASTPILPASWVMQSCALWLTIKVRQLVLGLEHTRLEGADLCTEQYDGNNS